MPTTDLLTTDHGLVALDSGRFADHGLVDYGLVALDSERFADHRLVTLGALGVLPSFFLSLVVA